MPRSPRWWLNHARKCDCGGYHFPHRKRGGLCHHSLSRGVLLARKHNAAISLGEKEHS